MVRCKCPTEGVSEMGKLRPRKRRDLFISVTSAFIAAVDWHLPRAWHGAQHGPPHTTCLVRGVLVSHLREGTVKAGEGNPSPKT